VDGDVTGPFRAMDIAQVRVGPGTSAQPFASRG